MTKPKHIHLDAVREGTLAFLRAYPQDVPGPNLALRPASTHLITWADDYARGADMARVALGRACQGLSSRKDDELLAAYALQEMSGDALTPRALEDLTGTQRDAWDGLLVLLDNLLRTGDPDTSADADAEERAEEDEPA